MKNIITFIVITTFIWSNLVWASGIETLAPKSSLPALYLPLQIDILTTEALRALNKEDVRDNCTLYKKRERIEEDIGRVIKGSKGKVRFLVFPDLDRTGEHAYYVFNMDEDYYIRITTTRDVKDRFKNVLDDIEQSISSGIEEVKMNGNVYYQEVFRISSRAKPFILQCLEKIYPLVEKSPEEPKEDLSGKKKRFLREPANLCNQEIWERYPGYSRFIGDSFKALREIKETVKVSIAVPMYKEEVRLKPKSQDNPDGEDAFRKKVLQLEAARLVNPLIQWELIFVDNGTPEGSSGKLVEKLWGEVQIECRENGIELDPSQVKVLYITPQEAKEMGSIKGGAVYKGMQYALSESNPDIIFYTDTDISVDLRQIGLLMEPIVSRGNDIAIGSRWLPGSLRDKKTIIDIAASRLYNLIVRLLLPLGNIKDTQCGFKAFRRDVLEKVIPFTRNNGFSFDTELLLLSKLAGSMIEEVPIAWFGSPVETKVNLLRDAFMMIVALWHQRMFFYETRIEVRLEPEDINVGSFIKYVCHRETAFRLPSEERLDLLSRSLSVLLKREDAGEIAEELRFYLITEKENILPSARMMIESYLAVYEIDEPITVAVCIALWAGQEDFEGRGWLRIKVEQFFRELISVNPNVNGFIVFVNDGDDSKDGKKTSDVIRELLKDKEYDDVRDKIFVLDLSGEDRQRMGSVKHGALACGMRFAVNNSADLVMYTDGDLSSHLGLSGLLLNSIINKGNDVAFGSIRKKGAIVPYRAFWRNLGTVIYNLWVRLLLKPIWGIKDTQRSFKAFKKEVLEKILPLTLTLSDPRPAWVPGAPMPKHGSWRGNGEGVLKIDFDTNFLYDFTGDTEWLGRARLLGYKLDEIPIVWIDTPETSTVDFWKQVVPMFFSAWRQRKTQNKLHYPPVFPEDLHRGKVDELKETHPALEKAANDGRMFALHIETARDIKKFFYLDDEDLINIFLGFLENLDNPGETRGKMFSRLENSAFRKGLIEGFQMMYDAVKGQSLPKDKPIRLCIVIEDENLPTVVFKDPFNNLISHSGRGEKTGIPYISIYAGYNSIKVAVERKTEGGFMELIGHEARDIIRGYHKDDYPFIVDEFYNKVLISVKPLVEIPSQTFLYDHMTSFFRNMPHYKWLREVVLPRVSPDKGKHIKIAVLGCSTGQEPISIAIWLLENGYKDFEIISIDRNPQVLEKFENGIYTQKEMNRFIIYGSEVFDYSGEEIRAMINRYFQYSPEDSTYTLRQELRDRLRNKVLSDITIPENIQNAVGKVDMLFYSNISYLYEEPAHTIVAEEISRVSDWVFVSTKKYEAIKRLTERYGLPIRRDWFYSLFWKAFKGLSQEWQVSIKGPFDEFTEHPIDGEVIAYIACAKEDLIKKYGPGLLSGIKDIKIVEKDGPASRDTVARIGVERLRDKLLVEDRLLYEAVHEILGLIIPDKPELADAVATLYRERWFSELSQEEQKELIRLGYTPKLELKGIDPTEVKKIENILKEVLILFNELIKATGGGDIEEGSIRIIRTFRDIRIEGKDIPKSVRRTIGYIAGWMDEIPDIVPEGIDLSKKHYVLVDKERAKAYKDTMDEISQKWNVQFVTEIPEGVDINDVVALVDPGDLDKWQLVEDLLCLPFPYMKISFALAAELASTGAELKNTKAFRFVKGFYENLFGITLTDEEVLSWFHIPKDIKAKLKLIKEKDFEILRLAIKKLDSST